MKEPGVAQVKNSGLSVDITELVSMSDVYMFFSASSNPLSPLVECSFLPREFIECNEPVDHKGNLTAKQHLKYGCLQFGGQRWEDVEKTKVCCRALDCIECRGSRSG